MSIIVKDSTLIVGTFSLLSLSLALITTPSQAAVINGSFESELTGWTKIGTAGSISGFGDAIPTDGSSQAGITTFSSEISTASLEGFLGLSSGSLNSLGNGQVTGGSAIQQTFTATAGDVISLDWNFLTFESTPNTNYNDFAFVSFNSLTELADTNSSFVDTSTIFREQTGYQTTSFTVATTGTYTLSLGVVNVGDTYSPSALLVDNVRTESVPEPASMLGILAFGALGGNKLWKRKQQKQSV